MQQLGAISQSTQAESDTVCYGFQITDLIEHGYDPVGRIYRAVRLRAGIRGVDRRGGLSW